MDTQFLSEHRLTFIENKGKKKFVPVVQKSWAECRGYCAEQKAHIRETAAHSEENWILGETNRSTGDNE